MKLMGGVCSDIVYSNLATNRTADISSDEPADNSAVGAANGTSFRSA